MITSRDKELISRLIKKYAGNISTDRMLAYIADNTGMLDVCRLLVKKNNEDERETISWVDDQCHQRQVDVRNFLYEIQQILSVFQPDHESDEHYSTLGLTAGASAEEIKDTYRKLSRRYHPDTSASNSSEDADMFIRINTAYQALQDNTTAEAKGSSPSQVSGTRWKQEKRKGSVSAAKKKKNVLWFSALTLVMVVVSIMAAGRYQKKAMITGLRLQQAAFIPPASTTEEASDTQTVFHRESASVELSDESAVAIEPAEVVVSVSEPEMSEQVIAQEEPIIEKETEIEESVPPVVTGTEMSQERVETTLQDKKISVENRDETEEVAAQQPSPKLQQDVKPAVVEKIKKPKESTTKATVAKVTVPVIALPVAHKTKNVVLEDAHTEMQERIEQFLEKYTAAYKNKNLQGFTRFFNEQTTENGKPIKDVLPTYKELFQSASEIRLDISILKWQNTGEQVELDGRFIIRIHYKNGKKVKGSGEIHFSLKDLSDKFLVREMLYQFDK